jgi:hypothetical protein
MENAFEKRIRAYALTVKRMQKNTEKQSKKAASVKRPATAGYGVGGGCLR